MKIPENYDVLVEKEEPRAKMETPKLLKEGFGVNIQTFHSLFYEELSSDFYLVTSKNTPIFTYYIELFNQNDTKCEVFLAINGLDSRDLTLEPFSSRKVIKTYPFNNKCLQCEGSNTIYVIFKDRNYQLAKFNIYLKGKIRSKI